MKALAASIVAIPASASSLVSRSCKVWKTRSERPRAGARIGRDMFDAEMIESAAHLRQASDRPFRQPPACKNNGCPDPYRGLRAGHAGQIPPPKPGTSKPCLPPRPEKPKEWRSSHRPASRSDRACAGRQATHALRLLSSSKG